MHTEYQSQATCIAAESNQAQHATSPAANPQQRQVQDTAVPPEHKQSNMVGWVLVGTGGVLFMAQVIPSLMIPSLWYGGLTWLPLLLIGVVLYVASYQ